MIAVGDPHGDRRPGEAVAGLCGVDAIRQRVPPN